MNKDRLLQLSQAEARELKDLVEAEMDRRFEAIKNKLDHYWTVVVGYDAELAWSELRELVDELVKSNLASLDKSLAIVLKVPPAEPVKVEALAVEVPEPAEEPVPEEPAEEPAPEEPAEEPVEEKPAEKASSRGSR